MVSCPHADPGSCRDRRDGDHNRLRHLDSDSWALSQVASLTSSALRSREHRLESCHAPLYRSAPWWCPIPGAKTGAASRVHVWSDAVRYGQLDRAQYSDQLIHPQSGPLFERLRGSGRRGREFKSPHPDQLRGPFPASGERAVCVRAPHMRHQPGKLP
jgi:hypothetical protein